MDCFFAAIEIRDNPTLKRSPVAVGGKIAERGVLSTCNYIARKFGLHSAMPTIRAFELCPNLILLPPAIEKYRSISKEIYTILRQFTDLVEPISLDEAYLDVTQNQLFKGSATWLAQHIRTTIRRTVHLTASAGIAPNKFLAKVASNWNKPNGQHVVSPSQIASFTNNLLVEKIPGVGVVTAKKLHNLNIYNCLQLQGLTKLKLIENFGKFGNTLYEFSRGIDERAVQNKRIRKSISVEHTFPRYLFIKDECQTALQVLYHRLVRRLKNEHSKRIHKNFIKVKFANFTQISRECTVTRLEYSGFKELLTAALYSNNQPVRLIGIGVRFQPDKLFVKQYSLF